MVFSLVTSVIPASSASASTLSRGPGYMYGGNTWMGGYVYRNVTVWCNIPFKSPATPAGSVVTNKVPGATAASVAKLNYILFNYGTKANPGQRYFKNNPYGAAIRLAVLTYTGTANKRLADKAKPHMPAATRNLLKVMIADAEMHSGPYRLVRSIMHPTLGKPGIATVKIVSIPTGRALPYQVLSLSAANAKLSASSVNTGKSGIGKVSFTKTAWADVRIGASNKNLLPSTSVRSWKRHSASFQGFLSAAPGVRVSAVARYHVSATNVGLAYACNSNCDGIVPVSFTKPVRNTYGGTARFVMIDNGVARRDYLQLAPGASGNKAWMIKDRHSAQVEVQVYVGGKWIKARLADRIVIDCPPLPQLTFSGHKDCVKGSLNLLVPAGTHPQRIFVNGVATQKPAGQAISVAVAFDCSKANSYNVQTAVQRTNKTWNSSSTDTFAFSAVSPS